MGIRQNSDLDIVVTDDFPPINIDGVEVMRDHASSKYTDVLMTMIW